MLILEELDHEIEKLNKHYLNRTQEEYMKEKDRRGVMMFECILKSLKSIHEKFTNLEDRIENLEDKLYGDDWRD